MSVTRSSSVAPRARPTSTSQRGAPVASRKEPSLPAGWATMTSALCTTMPGAVRRVRAGELRWTVHFFWPVAASMPTMRLSMLRATTTPCPTAGADRISLDSWLFQSALPSMSKAIRTPSAAPTTITLPSVPTPAVRPVPALMRHIWRPSAASTRAMSPSAPAMITVLPANAGENW